MNKTQNSVDKINPSNYPPEISEVTDTSGKSLFDKLSKKIESIKDSFKESVAMWELAKQQKAKIDQTLGDFSTDKYEKRIDKIDIPKAVLNELTKVLLGNNAKSLAEITQSADEKTLHFSIDGLSIDINHVADNLDSLDKYLLTIKNGADIMSEYILEDETDLIKLSKNKDNTLQEKVDLFQKYPIIADFLTSKTFTENRQIKKLGINNLKFNAIYRLIDDKDNTKLIFRDGDQKIIIEFEVEIKDLVTIKGIKNVKLYANEEVIAI